MSAIAEFTLAPEKLSFAAALSASSSVELDIEREYGAHSAMPVMFCWVRGGDLDAFETALADDETVTDVTRLSESGNPRLYRACLTGAAPVVTYDAWVEQGAARLEMRYADGRWHVRMRFPDRETLRAFRTFCDENALDFRLDRLYDSDPKRGPPRDRLTTSQRETLRLAHERGYFDIPRKVTLSDLADELGISNQAASERLRRGCERLASNLFG
ncbi:MAG TPA: helix-turn-helix domain-containing protein [Halococcus sp.]|nr:helix-turn-helix domain-containing protein [Halococcus sp.]